MANYVSREEIMDKAGEIVSLLFSGDIIKQGEEALRDIAWERIEMEDSPINRLGLASISTYYAIEKTMA